MSDNQLLTEILQACKTIAVVGLSANVARASYVVAKYMQGHGYRIIPVNPNYDSILGEKCYPDLHMIPDPVDMVNVFQRSERVMPFVEQAIHINARVVWMQLGIINRDAARLARVAGLEAIMDRCLKIEHARLLVPPEPS